MWTRLNLLWVLSQSQLNIKDWLSWIFQNGSNELCRKICCVMWVTWNERNKALHEGIKNSGRWAAEAVGKYLMELEELRTRIGDRLGGQEARGDILASRTVQHGNVASPFVVEALACSQAVAFGRRLGVNMVEIKGDSLAIINKCNSTEIDRLEIGNIIRDIQHNKAGFSEVRFKYLSRTTNRLAHSIATESLKRGMEMYLEGAILNFAEMSNGRGIQREQEPD
ncbi:hypothetical protein Gogos_005518 [Gossypium gossypioides]|uniref:RNase H type-1 domain-containing protein n=1 Tax=Gossypium gossypioides TaxID=34282 RepID=A0A7J9CZ15_GOSGO|nr:hypothetical protein [Gossypium gossypioides]